jgi:hypothetical protein
MEPGTVVLPIILATWETEIWKIKVQGQPEQVIRERPSPKRTRAKWTGGMVEHLSSNPSPIKKEKN